MSDLEPLWLSTTADQVETSNFTVYRRTITQLHGKTDYSVRLRLRYESDRETIWPSPPTVYVFRTANDHRQCLITVSECLAQGGGLGDKSRFRVHVVCLSISIECVLEQCDT